MTRTRRSDGFTLIELLVVIVVMGLLTAIAVPVFSAQEKKGNDSTLRADMLTAASSLQSYSTDNAIATAAPAQSTVTPYGLHISSGDTLKVTGSPQAGWCIQGNDTSGNAISGTASFWYDSNEGNMLPGSSKTPPGTDPGAACYPSNVSAQTPQTYTVSGGGSGGGGGSSGGAACTPTTYYVQPILCIKLVGFTNMTTNNRDYLAPIFAITDSDTSLAYSCAVSGTDPQSWTPSAAPVPSANACNYDGLLLWDDVALYSWGVQETSPNTVETYTDYAYQTLSNYQYNQPYAQSATLSVIYNPTSTQPTWTCFTHNTDKVCAES